MGHPEAVFAANKRHRRCHHTTTEGETIRGLQMWCLQEGNGTAVPPPPDLERSRVFTRSLGEDGRGSAVEPPRRERRPWASPPPAVTSKAGFHPGTPASETESGRPLRWQPTTSTSRRSPTNCRPHGHGRRPALRTRPPPQRRTFHLSGAAAPASRAPIDSHTCSLPTPEVTPTRHAPDLTTADEGAAAGDAGQGRDAEGGGERRRRVDGEPAPARAEESSLPPRESREARSPPPPSPAPRPLAGGPLGATGREGAGGGGGGGAGG